MGTVTLDTRKTLLKNQKVFSVLKDEEIEELATLLEEKSFPTGKVIVKEGDPVDSLYFIVNGEADVTGTVIKEDSRESIFLATLGPGKAIGLSDTGFYSLTGLRTATVTARSDMLLLYISLPRFNGFSLSHSHVNQMLRRNVGTA